MNKPSLTIRPAKTGVRERKHMGKMAVIGEGGQLIYPSGQLLVEVRKGDRVISSEIGDVLTIDPNKIDKDCTIVVRSIHKEDDKQ
ncbi:hypothetical protein [Priestia megaterium]|uniref:hypothetical protein n=1 Tax=Priestia megaterium TaxID=1404 RepID=UPI00300BCFDC